MGRIGLPELIAIIIIILLLFGAKRLPEIARSLGKALKEFKKSSEEPDDSKKTDSSGTASDRQE